MGHICPTLPFSLTGAKAGKTTSTIPKLMKQQQARKKKMKQSLTLTLRPHLLLLMIPLNWLKSRNRKDWNLLLLRRPVMMKR